MSNNSVRYNSSVVINNINEWPVDAHLMMAYRLSTWPVGWEEDDTVRFFSDFDSFHRVHASYRDWARDEDNAWRFALYVRENGVSLVLNPDAFIDGASPITSPVPGSGPDMLATASFGHPHTIAGTPVGSGHADNSTDDHVSDGLLAEILDVLWNPDRRVTLCKTSSCAFPSFSRSKKVQNMFLDGAGTPVGSGHADNSTDDHVSDDLLTEILDVLGNPDRRVTLREASSCVFPSFSRSKKVQNMFLDGAIRIFVSDNVCKVEGIPCQASSGDIPFNAIAASPEFAAFERSTPDEVVFVKKLVCATHVIDVAPVVADPYSPIELTLVRPLAWGLALYELDTICALTVDELRDAVILLDHD